MKTAVKNYNVEEKQKQQQLFNDGDQKKCVVNFLNNDSLAEIFIRLPVPDRIVMEIVCPEWKEACKLAWYNVKKYKCGHTIGRAYDDQLLTQSYVEQLFLRFGFYLKELSLSEIFNSTIMPIVANYCENLTRLEFVHNSKFRTKANRYIEAFKNLKKLTYIKIILFHVQGSRFQGEFPYEAINYLPEEMNEIHLLDRQDRFSKAVYFDLKRFKHLHSLTLSGCDLNKIFQAISEKTSLVYLDLTDFRSKDRCSSNIRHLFSQLTNLEHVSITIDKYNLNVPSSILNTCKNIRHLHLPSWSTHDRLEISIENWENLKNLEHLALSWRMTDEDADQLVKYCKKLKHLDFSRMCLVGTVHSALVKLTKLENLECLKLGKLHNFSDKIIIAISNNGKKLKTLKMEEICFMPPEQPHSPSVLSYLMKLQYLEELNLTWMTLNEFDETSFIALVNTCKNLTKLDISRCKNITEETLIALAKSESLKKLNVAHIDSVTDNFICKLKGLKCFNCRGCKKVTDAGVIQLINNCPDFEYLYLYGAHVTTDTIINASEATKNRKNNIVLFLYVDYILKESFKSLNKSIWLALGHC